MREGQECRTKRENERERLGRKKRRKKVALAIKDERAKATAKNERLLYPATEYYMKLQTLHHHEWVSSFYIPYIKIIIF